MVSTPLRDDFVGLVDSFSKPNRVVLSVEDGVIELHEGVTEDEHVLVVMSEDSKRHHRDSAFLLSSPVLSPVVRGQVKVLSINHEGHFRILEFISILAVPVALKYLFLPYLRSLMAHAGKLIRDVPESGVTVHFLVLQRPRLFPSILTSYSAMAKKTGWITLCQESEFFTKRLGS